MGFMDLKFESCVWVMMSDMCMCASDTCVRVK
jgi:hypothetical protein